MKLTKIALTVALSLTAVSLSGLSEASTLIQNVRVFDGQKMLSARNVLIDQGKIINPDFKAKVTADMKVIDGKGRSLLPGLIDSHVHAYQDQDLPLLYGVTTQIDMFTAVPLMQEANQRLAHGHSKDQADLISAGVLATAPGGHGTEYGFEIETLTKPEQAQAWVDKRIAEGSQFIKIVIEHGGAGYKFNSLDIATVEALIKAAHQRKKLAVVHIGTLEDAKVALAAGADGLVHLYVGSTISEEQSKELIALAKKNKSFVIPTMSVLESMAGIKAQDVMNDAGMMAYLTKTQTLPLSAPYGNVEKPQLMVAPKKLSAALYAAKVPVLAGTDAGNRGTQYGISMHHEMAALVDAGLTPSAALEAATSAPAQAFRLADRGRIAKGMKADLILVDGDPSIDISATRKIVEVWKDGEAVSALRDKKAAQVAQERAAKNKAVSLPADGRISLFTPEKLGSPFGFGWVPSNDAPMGGKSTVDVKVFADMDLAQNAVHIDANVNAGFAFPWAGVAFFPSAQPMQAADLSAATTLKFKLRGDGKTYTVGFTMQGSYIPVTANVVANKEWTEVSLPLAGFKGLDTSMITMLSFNAGPVSGHYVFDLADVRLVKE
ncbi:MAG: amidohydrolase [Burkholderiaceae bacterium]|nr:MAG: amidohydrolase [Burkholderiaceae bacterium]